MISLAFIIQVPTEDTPPSCKEWICAYLSAVAGGDDHTSRSSGGGIFGGNQERFFIFWRRWQQIFGGTVNSTPPLQATSTQIHLKPQMGDDVRPQNDGGD